MLKWSNVKYSNGQMVKYTNAQMHKCQMVKCSTGKCENTTCKCSPISLLPESQSTRKAVSCPSSVGTRPVEQRRNAKTTAKYKSNQCQSQSQSQRQKPKPKPQPKPKPKPKPMQTPVVQGGRNEPGTRHERSWNSWSCVSNPSSVGIPPMDSKTKNRQTPDALQTLRSVLAFGACKFCTCEFGFQPFAFGIWHVPLVNVALVV